MLTIEEVKKQILFLEEERRRLHNLMLDYNESKILLQNNCPHSEGTIFYGDPSGNNDHSTQCKICGKYL